MVGWVPQVFATESRPKKGIPLIKATVGGGTPDFRYRIKAKQGYHSGQGYGRVGTPGFRYWV